MASAARKKGYSFGLFFLLTLFTTVIAIVLVVVLPPRRATETVQDR